MAWTERGSPLGDGLGPWLDGGVGGLGGDDVGPAFTEARGGSEGFLEVAARGGPEPLLDDFFALGGTGLRDEGGGGVCELEPMTPCYQGIANVCPPVGQRRGKLLLTD